MAVWGVREGDGAPQYNRSLGKQDRRTQPKGEKEE